MRKFFGIIIASLIVLSSGISTGLSSRSTETRSDFDGGSGTMNDPYQISDVDQLQSISSDLSAYYELTSDIDASATESWNNGAGFSPIGSEESAFTGTIYGKGFNITGLWINTTEKYSGLFGYIQSGSILNISLNGTVLGKEYSGILCGYNKNGVIANCSVEGSIDSMRYVGGMVGSNSGKINYCLSNVNVTANRWTDCFKIGGMVGENWGTSMKSHSSGRIVVTCNSVYQVGGFSGITSLELSNCTSTSSVYVRGNTSMNYWPVREIGGLSGGAAGKVVSSLSTGDVTVYGNETYNIGGLVGFTGRDALIKYSYSTGDIEVNSSGNEAYQIGGLIGKIYRSIIRNCYSHSNVRVISLGRYIGRVGGLVGESYQAKPMAHCYSTGYVYVNGTNAVIKVIGGCLGTNENQQTFACFHDNETSGQKDGAGGGWDLDDVMGRNTSDMMKKSTFTGHGWDFDNDWSIIENMTYPFLKVMYHSPFIFIEEPLLAIEDQEFSSNFQIIISDIVPLNDLERVDVRTDAGPWLKIDTVGRRIHGIPLNEDVGTYWINISASDRVGFMDYINTTITVNNTNDPPEITSDLIPDAVEDEGFDYSILAIDIDPVGDIISWHMTSDQDWLIIDPLSGRLSGIPRNGDVGDCWANISIDDGNNGTDEKNFTFSVMNTNDDPEILGSFNFNVSEDEEFRYQMNAVDIDPTNDELTWSVENAPDWINVDIVQNMMNGIPENEDVGIYSITIEVDDGKGGYDSENITINVIGVNDPPVIYGDPNITTYEDEEYFEIFTSFDIEEDDLEWSLITDAEWLEMEGNTGHIFGIPTNDDVGKYTVNITLSDGTDLAYYEYELQVLNVNDPPIWIDLAEDTDIVHDNTYEFDLEATDIEDDTLTFSISSKPESAITIDKESGLIEWKADIFMFDQEPFELLVNVSVSDGYDSAYGEFTITVVPTEPPMVELMKPGYNSRISGLDILLSWEGFDPENETITYDIYLDQTQNNIRARKEESLYKTGYTSTNLMLTDMEEGKIYYWTVIPFDGFNTGNCIDDIFTFSVNNKPTISPISDLIINSGENLRLQVEVDDKDEDDRFNLRFSLIKSPSGMNIDEGTGLITWKTDEPIDEFIVKIEISDGIDSSQESFKIQVVEEEGENENNNNLIIMIFAIIVLIAIVTTGLLLIIRYRKGSKDADVNTDQIPSDDPDKNGSIPSIATEDASPAMENGHGNISEPSVDKYDTDQ